MKLSIFCLGRLLLNPLGLRTGFTCLVLGAILPFLAGCGRFENEFAIQSETAKVIVSRDGTALVSEAFDIKVKASWNDGGVYVDIPQRFTDSRGNAHWRTFELLSTLRDGSDEHHSYASSPDGHSIYIGRPACKGCKSNLPVGATQIEIGYKLGRLISEKDGHQILALPAYMASVHGQALKKTIVFSVPEGGKLRVLSIDQQGYEIRQTRSNDLVVSIDPGQSDRTLRDIEIEYPAGTFPAATDADNVRWWFLDHILIVAALSGPLMGLLLIGFNLRGRRRSREPVAATVEDIRLDKISPTMIAYVHLKWQEPLAKKRAFMAFICRLAIERRFRMSGVGEEAEISDVAAHGQKHQNGMDPTDPRNLQAFILAKIDMLRPYRNSVRASRVLAIMDDRLRLTAIDEWRKIGGKNGANYAWVIILILVSMPVVAYLSGLATFVGSFLLLLFISFPAIEKLLHLKKLHAPARAESQPRGVLGTFVGLPILVFIAASYLINNPASSEQLPYLIAVCVSILCIVLIAVMWSAPTPREKHLGNDLSILRRYLTGELKGPAMSVEIYERFLPYAVAFGLEQQWTADFDHWAKAAGMAGCGPDWLIRAENEKLPTAGHPG